MRKQKKKRAVRQNSNVFAIFDQKQIAEFKEAFSMFDHDADGFVDKEDLKDMLASLGKAYSRTPLGALNCFWADFGALEYSSTCFKTYPFTNAKNHEWDQDH